jgi:hypothetical protein
MSDRPLIIIQAGSSKFLGLSLQEWVLLLAIGVFIMIFVPSSYYGWLAVIFFIFAMLYGQLISKLEQDAIRTFQKNYQISDVVVGFFENPIPIDVKKEEINETAK